LRSFPGFTIRVNIEDTKVGKKLIPTLQISRKSKAAILEKFRGRGMINYYSKFRSSHTRDIWYRLNVRLTKWVRWEKGLSTRTALRYLIRKYREQPGLFPHWIWVHP
jgi:hypothetical protein